MSVTRRAANLHEVVAEETAIQEFCTHDCIDCGRPFTRRGCHCVGGRWDMCDACREREYFARAHEAYLDSRTDCGEHHSDEKEN